MKTLCFCVTTESAIASSPPGLYRILQVFSHLLVTDGEPALRFLVVLRKLLELQNGLVLQHRGSELDIRLGVFVARLNQPTPVSRLPASQHTVHIWTLTKTTVSSGKAAKVLFSALCISSAVPSKNLPQPETDGRRLVSTTKPFLTVLRVKRDYGTTLPLWKRVSPVKTTF